jgi:hypothetical protein
MYVNDMVSVVTLTAWLLAQEGPLSRNLLLAAVTNERMRQMLERATRLVPEEMAPVRTLGQLLGPAPPVSLPPPEKEPKK